MINNKSNRMESLISPTQTMHKLLTLTTFKMEATFYLKPKVKNENIDD